MADDEKVPEFQRLILLNRLVSRSATRARQASPPTHSGRELLEAIEARRTAGLAIEFYGLRDREEMDEKKRMAAGHGHDYVALRDYDTEQRGGLTFVKMLIEFVDESAKGFPVVDTSTFAGRELGKKNERGATGAHVVVRLPKPDDYDDGSYRCAIESVHPITRTDIERFLCHQLYRAYSTSTFSVIVEKKGRRQKPEEKVYRYWPRLELFADVSRKIDFALDGGKQLYQMVFTKRHEKQSIAKPTAVRHDDEFVADVEYRVSASQGPSEPNARMAWVETVRTHYKNRGFESKLYYRTVGGATVSSDVHKAVAGATDLLMCPKEVIILNEPLKPWQETINSEIVDSMIELLDNPDLWERKK